MFEVNAGYTADFSASAEITNGISASKTISVGRKWDAASGWQDIFDNPPVSLTFLGPIWQMQGSADIRAYLQPKVTLLIYSAAGVSADLEPYLELARQRPIESVPMGPRALRRPGQHHRAGPQRLG